uniref:Uncharacterized protein n=1 Tax=Lutzomyia longipalpis TaxID=7200 RepID=A0A1B0CA84_LUTLO
MGSSTSKFLQTMQEKKEVEEKCEIDPRSPSLHISRTPINEFLLKANSRITKAQDLTTNIETPLGGSYESISTRTKQLELLALDPRSPSQGIQRTPLSVGVSDDDEEEEAAQESAGESFESALSKIDFNDDDGDGKEEQPEKKLLETNFDYKPPEGAALVENTIDPRSPGLERTPSVFEDEAPPTSVMKDCENATPKSVRNVAPVKVFHDENTQQQQQQHLTPKQLIVGQEGNRTPLSCLANRGIPRSSLKTPANSQNFPVKTIGRGGTITKSATQSKIPLPTRRCVEN